jgi:HAD superfamily hydrolase (TIGR01509 family)
MSVIKAFFFDLDGTLVDTHKANVAAYSEAIFQVTSKEPSESLYEHIKNGTSSKDFLPSVVEGITEENLRDINDKKKELYLDHLHKSVLNDFLSNFLKQVFLHSVTVLVTTAKKDNALAVLRHHELEDYFTYMVFGDDVDNMKPHPDAYLLALEKTGLQIGEVLAFEDSEKGVEAANAAGINVVHIRTFES